MWAMLILPHDIGQDGSSIEGQVFWYVFWQKAPHWMVKVSDKRPTACASAAASALHQKASKCEQSRARSGRLHARVSPLQYGFELLYQGLDVVLYSLLACVQFRSSCFHIGDPFLTFVHSTFQGR